MRHRFDISRWGGVGLVLAALISLPPASLARDYGPYSQADLISLELAHMAPSATQPFADALARSELFEQRMQVNFIHQNPQRALVLYDWSGDPHTARRARLSAIMIRNLLGHFNLEVHLHRVNDYEAGQMEGYDATIYVGEIFDNPLPSAFLRDASRTENTLIWMQYNLHQLEQFRAGSVRARGLILEGSGDEVVASGAQVRPAFYDTVFYRGLPFVKFFAPATDEHHALYDPAMVPVYATAETQTLVEIGNSQTGEVRPYITRQRNFWFVAEIPLSFTGARDRYLVFADILHDMLGLSHDATHQAMVRIEDLHAQVGLQGFHRLTGLLERYDVPYSLAVIPEFREVRADGTVLSVPVDSAPATQFREAMADAVDQGAQVIMHGVTHQYADRPNPDRGTSGEDFEFWDAANDGPVEDNSIEWAMRRTQRGYDTMVRAGFRPTIFETPHYLGSPNASLGARLVFPYTYQRVAYYGADDLNPFAEVLRDEYEIQFFPYMIYQDHYGQVVVPENLGNLQYTPPVQSADYLLRNAAYGLAVRDGVASLFVHSFLFVPYMGVPAYSDFTSVIEGISAMGYDWVGVDEYLTQHGMDPDARVGNTTSD